VPDRVRRRCIRANRRAPHARPAVYHPQFEDWLFHVPLPLVAYAMLAVAAFAAPSHTREAFFAVGGAALVLLFAGIHNAWDSISYHVASTHEAHAQRRYDSDATR
jgi:hypothetical protein